MPGSNSKPKPVKVCAWCEDPTRESTHPLTQNKTTLWFCSEGCRKEHCDVYKVQTKCANCDCTVTGVPVTNSTELSLSPGKNEQKEYCSTDCLQKFRLKNSQSQKPPLSKTLSKPVHLHAPLLQAAMKPESQSTQHQQSELASQSPVSTTSTAKKEEVVVAESSEPEDVATPEKPKTGGKRVQATPRVHHHYETFGTFSWDEYLKEVGGNPAPAEFFKQSRETLVNEFKLHMKLESQDPRNTSSTCVGTVVGIMGPRIQIRLDGSDNANDSWELIDSDSIKPLGTCVKNGGMLQPPLGFRKNPSTFHIFLAATLTDASVAPDSCFKKGPRGPDTNQFEAGMKLEAIDRKNPRLICPATVGDVRENEILVEFDGWKGAFDYWTTFDSREIFPVGWCQKVGHPLQPPGDKVGDLKDVKKGKYPSYILPSPLTGTLPKMPNAAATTPVTNGSGRPKRVASNTPNSTPSPNLAPKLVFKAVADKPSLAPKVAETAPKQIAPKPAQATTAKPTMTPVKVPSAPPTPQSAKTSESRPSTPLRPASTVTSPKAVNGAGVPPLLLQKKSPVAYSARDSNVNVSSPIPATARKRMGHANGSVSNANSVKASPVPGSGLNGAAPIQTPKRKAPEESREQSPASASQPSPAKKMPIPSSPLDWAPNDVMRYLTSVDASLLIHAEIFDKHEIDGKAFLLLNSDMMMKYMGLKLGPALKICNIIERLKGNKKGLTSIVG